MTRATAPGHVPAVTGAMCAFGLTTAEAAARLAPAVLIADTLHKWFVRRRSRAPGARAAIARGA